MILLACEQTDQSTVVGLVSQSGVNLVSLFLSLLVDN
jgi:hypothetical protein